MPLFACFLIFMSLSSMGLPGLNGFIGEVLSLIGMFKAHPVYAVLGAVGIVLGAWYLLNMLQQSLFGRQRDLPGHHGLVDLNTREVFALAPIAVLCLAIGIFPGYFLNVMKPEVDAIASIYPQTVSETFVAAAAVDLPSENP
jgi:NADH-quinone oxidoreductase subunit M